MVSNHSYAPGDFAFGLSPPLWRPQIAIDPKKVDNSRIHFTLHYGFLFFENYLDTLIVHFLRHIFNKKIGG